VKNSTSDLFISNCDEFIYYDDLVRAEPAKVRPKGVTRTAIKPEDVSAQPRAPDPTKAIELLVATVNALTDERGADESIWASMVKQAIKRRNPGFNERAYGFSAFTDLLREAQKRGLLKLDEKSGNCQVRLQE
jgi:hypothetical protein